MGILIASRACTERGSKHGPNEWCRGVVVITTAKLY